MKKLIGSFLLIPFLFGCVSIPMGRQDILRAQDNSKLIYHQIFDRPDFDGIYEVPQVFGTDGQLLGNFSMGKDGDFSLYYSPVATGKRKKVWTYSDYGGFGKISQANDSKTLFVFYSYGLIFWHYRVAIINAVNGNVRSRRLSESDFSILASTKTYTNTMAQQGGPAEATAGGNSPLPPR